MKITNLFRFSLFVLSLVFSVNVAFAQLSDPIVSYVGDGCSTVKFEIENYDSSLAYDVDVNGTLVSLESDGTYTESSPVRDFDYTISVSCKDAAAGLSSSVVTSTAKLPKTVESPTITADNGCDAPVKFTIANYNSSLTYTWTINGNQYPATGSSFEYQTPQDGVEYTATVKVDDGCTSATSNSVSQTYIVTPVDPVLSAMQDCGEPIIFKLENSSSYAGYTQEWKLNDTGVTPSGDTYTYYDFSDKATYKLEVTISNSTCKSNTVSTQIVAKSVPNSPEVKNYDECQTQTTGDYYYWADLVKKDDPSYELVWYDSPVAVSPVPAPIQFDKSKILDKVYWVAQKDKCTSARSQVNVNVYKMPDPFTIIIDPVAICEEESAVLTVNKTETGMSYSWEPRNSISGGHESYTVTTEQLDSETEFTLTVSNTVKAACNSSNTVKVPVLKKPEISLTVDKPKICQGGEVKITNTTAKSGEEYSWEVIDINGTRPLRESGSSVTLTGLQVDTKIKLTAWVAGKPGCESSSDIDVQVIKRPVANAGPATNVCYGEDVMIGTTEEQNVSYSWTPIEGLDNPNIATPTVLNVTQNIEYTLYVTSTDVDNCVSAPSKVKITKVDNPTIYDVSGGGSFCAGSASNGMQVILNRAASGTEYQLVKNGAPLGSWVEGKNTSLSWPNTESGVSYIGEGVYTVKARKKSHNSCIADMNGQVTVTAVTAPEVEIKMDGSVACPGKEVTVRIQVKNGVAPYDVVLLTDGAQETIRIEGQEHVIKETPNKTIKYEIASIQDAVCRKDYTPYLTFEVEVPSLENFVIHSTNNDQPVCADIPVDLYIDYTEPATYLWSTQETSDRISVSSTTDAVFYLDVTTADGCVIPQQKYTLEVIEKTPITFGEFLKRDNNDVPFLCSTDANFTLEATPSGGRLTSKPAGLITNNTTIVPSAINETTEFELTYSYIYAGCPQDTTFSFIVSAINKEVDWTLAPAFDPPWPEDGYEFCQPNPNAPKQTVSLQGNPPVGKGEWSIGTVVDEHGVEITSAAYIHPKTGNVNGETSLYDITAGETYNIVYKVVDNYGCVGEKRKSIKINGKPTEYFESNGIEVLPNDTLCIESVENAIIQSNNPMGDFILDGADRAMFVSSVPGAGKLVIDPSKGTAGEHKVIYNIVHEGCSYSESVNIYIKHPTRITSYNIPKEYCYKDAKQVITITSGEPTTGEIKIIDETGTVKLSNTPIEASPAFDPSWGPGTYTIEYHYNDKYCDYVHSDEVVVHPLPEIDFQMKDNYCYGETITMIPNYTGGKFTIDSSLDPSILEDGYKFNTKKSGIGDFTVKYVVTDKFGCEGSSSKNFKVLGVKDIAVEVKGYFCEPAGTYTVEGFPKRPNLTSPDEVYFTTDPAIGLTDNNDGTAEIDLTNSKYDTSYPITYHYKLAYEENGVPYTCESTATKNFNVLSQASDFSGYNNEEVLCSDAEPIEIVANHRDNTVFSVSLSMQPYPNAFIDNDDGTAMLYPAELPEGYYSITMSHVYYDLSGVPVCNTSKTKAFYISKIEEITDISLYCHPDNVTSVKINNSEKGIRYDLYVNGDVYDSHTTTAVNEEVNFKGITNHEAAVYVVGVDPRAKSCTLHMSKEFNIVQLSATVKSKDISCHDEIDGEFVGEAAGGVPDYKHKLINSDSGAEVLQWSSSIVLPQGNYEYVVEDKIGCHRTIPFVINEPNKLKANLEQSDVDCYGGTDAQLKADAIGGVGPYKYTWYEVESTGNQLIKEEATLTVGKGVYKVIIEDGNKCTFDTTAVIEAPDEELVVKLDSKVDVKIRNAATGEIYVSASGGTKDASGGYKYTWVGNSINDTNRHLEDLQGLKYGTYELTVEDAKGCKAYLSVYIAQPTPLIVEPIVVDPKCFGDDNGKISLKIGGGTEPYVITWMDENLNIINSGKDMTELGSLVSGLYNIKVEDADGNSYEDKILVGVNSLLEVTNPLLEVETSILSELNNACYGDTTGVIELKISGGTKSYIVDWGTIEPYKIESNTRAVNLRASTYNIVVKDTNGCSVVHEVTINEPEKPLGLLSETVKQNICHGASEGYIKLEMQGGTPNYKFVWNGIDVNTYAQEQINLKAGEEYKVTVTDSKGCVWDSIYTMINPVELTFTLDAHDIKCNGDDDGYIVSTIVTGEAPFTYLWKDSYSNDKGTDPNIDELAADVYTVEVTDRLGCKVTKGAEIKEPTKVEGTIKSKDISCHDKNDGKISVSAVGGTGIFTYALYKVGDTSPITTDYEKYPLEKGDYKYIVMDENGCSWSSDIVSIINPKPILIEEDVTDVTINGGSNGSIDLTLSGGTQGLTGYIVKWTYGESIVSDPTDPAFNEDKEDIDNLKAGLYTVTVTDANTCDATKDIIVKEPNVISFEVEVKDVACYGGNTGRIQVINVEGGTGAGTYTFDWVAKTSGNTYSGQIINNLPADIYALTIRDAAGAEATQEVKVTEPEELIISTVQELSTLSVGCYGNKTGEITVEIQGGTEPYLFSWDGIAASDGIYNLQNLEAGVYKISLKDANGCEPQTQYKETISGPGAELTIDVVIDDNECYGKSEAKIDITVSGGTAPYTYSWIGSGITPDKSEDEDQSNLRNGETYTVTVKDALGCTLTRQFPLAERYEILVATNTKNVLCHGDGDGELHAQVSGGSGRLSPKWESEDGAFSETSLDITNMPAGKYIFSVTDDVGCVITKEEFITQPNELKATIIGSAVLCSGVDDGELYVQVEGGTEPYDYKWDKDGNLHGAGAHLTGQGAGKYKVAVTDKNGCSAVDDTEIKSSTPISIDNVIVKDVDIPGYATGSIEIAISGGTPQLTTFWQGDGIDPDKATDQNQYNLIAGDYEVIVTDGLGCYVTQEFTVIQPEDLKVTPIITDIKCFNDLGNIILKVTGGSEPYSYEWNGPNGFYRKGTEYDEISNLEPGKYEVTITDKNGINKGRTYNINAKEQLTWILQDHKTELNCKGDSDGYINIDVKGGTKPYSIKWSGPELDKQDVMSVLGLSAGVYKAEITDENGCPIDVPLSIEVTEPDEALKLEASLTHNLCATDKSGAIDVTVSGGTPDLSSGTPDYKYSWSGFDVIPTAEDQENLPKGKYTLNVEDANRCTIDTVLYILANNEINATINGPSNVCSSEEFPILIDVNGGFAQWTIEYSDGEQTYTETTSETSNLYTHTLERSAEFNLVSVVDDKGCHAKLKGRVLVNVHEKPKMTVVSAQEDCCLDEPALLDIIFSGVGPWIIKYTDGTTEYTAGPFVADRDYLKIIPTEVGTKTYTIKSISNENCTVPVDYSVDITAYTYPNLQVDMDPSICEPNPLKVYLHATGESPWHVVYYLNDHKYEYDMLQEEEVIDIYPNRTENVFLFESIQTGQRCITKLDKKIQSQMDLKPKDATTIIGSNMVCRNSETTFTTTDIMYATSYEWSLPNGFNIKSGLGSTNIVVEISDTAESGPVKVWGKNACGDGVHTTINVEVDKPIATTGEISMPAYVCDNNTIFALSVSDVENATNYEWVMPAGYNILSGQGTRAIMVQIDKYALSNTVSVIPSNICTEGKPITATILIRPLPFAEAGTDFITSCSPEAILSATKGHNVVSSEWKLLRGNAIFEDPTLNNTKVSELMYGENLLSWNVNDGYCVGYDTVKVTNQNPGITDPEFSEVTICEDYMTLRAGQPEFGMGRWTLIAGDGKIENPNSNETLVSGLSNKRTNVIRWEVYSPQCSNSIDVQVISHSLHALVDAGEDGMSTTGSFRLSARVVNDSNITGTWSVVGGEGTIEDPNNPNTIVTGLATGINTLRWTLTGYECDAYDEIHIRMVDEPIASFNIENTEGCEPLTVLFTNTTIGKAEYKWEFGDGSTSNLRNPEHIYEKAGVYTVKMTAIGEKRQDVMTGVVTVLPSPVAAFSAAERQLYVPNAEAHFYNETEEAVQYLWDFGDGGTSNSQNPVYTYLEDGLYDVKYIVTDKNLCSDTLLVEDYIKVGKDSYLVFPTAFTPNVERSNGGAYSEGERRLDVFYPIGRNVDTYKLEIFSSWGNKVFESNDQYIGWDGYYLGQCAAQGTYFYKAEGRFKDGNAFQYSGNLMLIR